MGVANCSWFGPVSVNLIMRYAARMDYLAWLRDGLNKKGKTQRGLAKHMGIDETIVSKIVNGKREIKADELSQIAEYLGAPMPSQLAVTTRPLSTIPVIPIHLTLGVWKEVGGVTMESATESVPALSDPRWAGLSQYAAYLNGSKSYAVCVRFSEIRQRPIAGDTVHVTRTKGGMQEDTMREVVVTRGKVTLRNKSLNEGVPDHELPWPSDQRDETLEIQGLVVGIFHSLV